MVIGADSRMIDRLRLICALRDMGREGRCPSRESHECLFYIYIYMYVLRSTAAAQLIRRKRNLKLCQTKLELFMSLSLLLLALAGSACIKCGTCTGWDVEGLFPGGLPGVGHISTSKIQCVQSCSLLLSVQGLALSALAVLLHRQLLCTNAALGWPSNSPSLAFLSCQRKITRVEALIPLVAK